MAALLNQTCIRFCTASHGLRSCLLGSRYMFYRLDTRIFAVCALPIYST
nr:MAG TPA: hypothetical protein [Caudoviricetes sp.]DAH76318.1 MAG TPA: hypothetical protein [Caudoviricetes sp.]